MSGADENDTGFVPRIQGLASGAVKGIEWIEVLGQLSTSSMVFYWRVEPKERRGWMAVLNSLPSSEGVRAEGATQAVSLSPPGRLL